MGAAVPRTRSVWPIGRNANDRLDPRQGTPFGIGRKRGEQIQAIGRSRGGRNTKVHAIADAKGRLLSILLSGGEAHDCPPAVPLIRRTKPARTLPGNDFRTFSGLHTTHGPNPQLLKGLVSQSTRIVLPHVVNESLTNNDVNEYVD
jgi:hypothetical protein